MLLASACLRLMGVHGRPHSDAVIDCLPLPRHNRLLSACWASVLREHQKVLYHLKILGYGKHLSPLHRKRGACWHSVSWTWEPRNPSGKEARFFSGSFPVRRFDTCSKDAEKRLGGEPQRSAPPPPGRAQVAGSTPAAQGKLG